MKRILGRKPSARILVSLILLTTTALGLVSAALYAGSIFTTVSFHSPTATYTGSLSIGYTGVYPYLTAEPLCSHSLPPCGTPSELVWYLTTGNDTIRLIFFCGPDTCSRAQQLPFHDGDRIYVKGTLLQPSNGPTIEYQPTLQFTADLYVFKYAAA